MSTSGEEWSTRCVPRAGTAEFLREVERAVWSVDSNLPLADVQTLEEIRSRSMARTSFAVVMLGIAEGVALAIGIVGIYGVIAYGASQRTRELGVRMALGARVWDVRTMFLKQGLVLTATGIALGIGVAVDPCLARRGLAALCTDTRTA